MNQIRSFLCAMGLVAGMGLPAQAIAQQCPHVTIEEYTDARFVFCRSHIEERMRIAQLQLRYDGSEQMISFEDAERLIIEMNALARGDASNLDEQLGKRAKLRSILRGLVALEMFPNSAEAYCKFKFPSDEVADLALPKAGDPERVRDIDYFFGCKE